MTITNTVFDSKYCSIKLCKTALSFCSSQNTSNRRRSRAFFYNFQTEKSLWRCFFIKHILYTAFCDQLYLFNDLSTPRSLHLMISEYPNEVHLCMKRTWNYNMLFEFAWKTSYQRKGFHTYSYIFVRLLLWLPLTAAIVLEQFRIELFAVV